ncbi:hypothetical protein BDY17DRAFT_317098 [Neohortaea acidophila]|uniref:Retinol dehydrogenase 12 n=1 Tax=Neohortaea acidophila TaxID=245834 RepID=A0A6A6PQV5_9PEZI|nr:uncharacterized protein BDY17DRAFT_317098 [Neohortaea acidophila]KAF2482392.1 hypothetical protein BDY17DRAFT_317098 [Neohortaea acidophila]
MSGIVRAAQTTLSQNLGGVAHDLAPNDAKFSLDDVPDQSNKVALVTGGSEGIGYAVVHTLLSKNIAKVFILSLSQQPIKDAVQAIKEDLGENVADRVVWKQCDVGDWKRATEVAQEVQKETDRLDVLVCNAGRGIMTFEQLDNGVERHMGVNHIGHVVLTSHLLPLLKKTAEHSTVRISNQASNAHEQAPKDTHFRDLEELNQDLGPLALYGRSKLAVILYSRYLTRHLHTAHPNILINATHPGVVETTMSTRDILEPYPIAGHLMKDVMAPFKKDQFQGALPTLYAISATTKSGEYICPPADPEPGSALAQDDQLGEQLMKMTREIVTEKTRMESVDKGCPMQDY